MARREVGMVWSWGTGSSGQLGNNATDNQSSPVSIVRSARYSSIGKGGLRSSYSAAIDASDGMIWSWGRNNYGQLGNDSTNNESSPISIAHPGSYVKVALGYGFALALDSSGMVWAWGINSFGYLGNDSTNDQSSPVSIARPGSYVDISAGLSNGMALDSSGTVWVWGKNNNGQIGDGTSNTANEENRSSPVSIVRPGSYVKISSADESTYAIDSSGMIWAWGQGTQGELGNGSTNNESSPVSIARAGSYIDIQGGYDWCLALDSSGMIWGWGDAAYGQLGNDSTNDQSSPVSIVRPGSYIDIGTGRRTAYAIDSDGAAWAWGSAASGTLGDNTSTSNVSSPVSVAKPGRYIQIAGGWYPAQALRLEPLSYFSDTTSSDGATVTSSLDRQEIVNVIADNVTDTYFDSTNEVDSVEVKYVHEDGRQKKVILHSGQGLTGQASWSALTRDGTWQKTEVTVRDSVGASRTLTRDEIGNSEDLTHSDGTMNLNV